MTRVQTANIVVTVTLVEQYGSLPFVPVGGEKVQFHVFERVLCDAGVVAHRLHAYIIGACCIT